MIKKSPISIKYFPFAPGIPWEIKYGKYISPKVSGSIIRSLLSDKDIVVVAYGGLLESFFSLSILETMNYMLPGNNLFWCGNSEFYPLVKYNGLAKTTSIMDQKTLRCFPTPIFFDKNNRAYFNCLVNYMEYRAYYDEPGFFDKRSVITQIVEKSTVPWDNRFIPNLRYLEKNIKAFLKKGRAPYILIFPDRTGTSQHDIECLNWNTRQIRSFVTMLQPEFKPVLVVKDPSLYYNINAEIIPFTLENVFSLITKSYAVLSKDIDILLLSLALSKAKIISLPTEKAYSFGKSVSFLMNNNDIYTAKDLLPETAWGFLRS